jgi:hypothetical protein
MRPSRFRPFSLGFLLEMQPPTTELCAIHLLFNARDVNGPGFRESDAWMGRLPGSGTPALQRESSPPWSGGQFLELEDPVFGFETGCYHDAQGGWRDYPEFPFTTTSPSGWPGRLSTDERAF